MNYEKRLTELTIEIHEKARNLADITETRFGYVPALVQEIVSYSWIALKSNADQPRVPAGYTTGGAYTADGTNGGQPIGWGGDLESLQRNYIRHGKDFGVSSPQEYIDKAKSFYQKFQDESLPAVSDINGYTKIYDPESNTFAVYNPDGDPMTLYQPTSPTYYERETQKILEKGGKIINPSSSGGGSSGIPTGKPGDNPGDSWDILD
jgi:hypothetical protein